MMKMKDADAFERSLKEALDAYEVPYNSADWAQLEHKLDPQKTSTWQASAGLYALFLGGAVAVITTAYVMLNDVPLGNGNTGVAAMVISDEVDGSHKNEASFDIDRIGEIEGTTEQITMPEAEINEAPLVASSALEGTPVSPVTSKKASVQLAKTVSSVDRITEKVMTEEVAATPKGVAIKPSITEGCPGVTVEFSVENMPEDGIHLWNFGDGSFSNKPTPAHTFSKSGTFEVMLSHSSIGGGNIRNKPASDRIVIHEAPEAAFHLRKDEYDNTVPSVRFDNRSIGGSKYHWDLGDGNSSTIAHPNHVYKKKGTYQVTLTTTNAKGCIDRADRTIVIDNDYNLLASRTFSPDNNGFEDSFIPEALKTLGVKFQMSIFDSTTGALLYDTTDPQRPWNGRIGNKGALCEPGEYVWLVEMKDGALLGGTYTGNVSLLR